MKIIFIIILFFCLFYSVLFSETRDWVQMYPMIDRLVADMKFSTISGITEYGLLFALPGNDGGLAYFTNPDSLNIFNFASNLGAVSIVSDNINNRIFCAFGGFSNSDGLYEFNVSTQDFELITWRPFPYFVNKMTSGYYFGYIYGLLHSMNGDEWSEIEFFDDMNVTDIEENGDGTLFVAADYDIYIEDDGSFNSFTVGLIINDIYVRNYPNNDEVYLACGAGGYTNYVLRVEYENGEITDLTTINIFYYPNRIYEYEGFLVVGCKDGGGLYLVEPEENGQVQQIGAGLGINDVYCFEFYPIYTPNFMVGTDIGVFLATNLTSASNNELTEINSATLLNNHPNPFNPITTISFDIKEHETGILTIFNIKGQLIESHRFESGKYNYLWDASEQASGIYFYKLQTESITETRKMLLLK
jgi:hypothetical protein